MQFLKEMMLGGYYLATQPARRRAAADRVARRMEPISILFYHRVSDKCRNAWTMPCATFQRQIDWMIDRFDVITLEEAQRRIARGENQWPSVCLTFDDGYADNCEFALPLLLRKDLPFTYFVSTNHVLRGEFFPHDTAANCPLRPNSLAEIRAMADAGVEIGAHTRSHPDLGKVVNEEALRDEIAGSKQELEEALGRRVRYFAFPFGLHQNMSHAAWRVVHQAGFDGACSAYGSYNWPGEDPFHLQRIHADPEMIRLKNWVTVDARKIKVEQYDPGDYRGQPTSQAIATEAGH